ncbi:MAG TPA: ABC transporter ATP-binding protein [Terriglobales bacterium]|nr:ABC transporter ATP-binding protein [Terriglobales bacterium]
MASSLSTPAAVPVVSVTGLIKQFGRFAALRGVTAEFDAGRIYAILGDNGAGKTTLLRTLAGLSAPTRGVVEVLGNVDLRLVRSDIGYMAHPSLLYDEMSAIENLRYFAGLYGKSDQSAAGRSKAPSLHESCAVLIRLVGLDPALNRPVGQYSQGMRQRLSLARALVNNPAVLFLDEPFSNVDVKSAEAMVGLLKHLRGEGRTLFVVTHQASLLNGVADEFVNMEAGQIVSRTAGL